LNTTKLLAQKISRMSTLRRLFTALAFSISTQGRVRAFVTVRYTTRPCQPAGRSLLGTGTRSSAALFRRGGVAFSGGAGRVSMAGAAIVGRGRIGNALFDMGGGKDTLIGRGDEVPDGEGPIYVCTRNDDLENVISRTPVSRREDLVFLQNGVLRPLLEKHGLESNTQARTTRQGGWMLCQALIYFAVSKKGETPLDGVTDANPEGLNSTCGKWANEFKERLAKSGLTCHVLPEDRRDRTALPRKRWRPSYTAKVFEKHIWICAFMVCGAFHKCNIGEVEVNHSDEVRALISEMQAAISAEYGVTFEEGVQDRLCAYARSVAHYPAALKEYSWRNGFFWEISAKAKKENKDDPCPLHSKLLQQVANEQGMTL
ncbi:unnamed protein product, partial [Ascophyllum nodosum]